MKRRILLRPQAENEFLADYAWCESRQVGLGDRFRAEIQAVFDTIILNPEAYPLTRMGVRRAAVRRFPCIIIYAPEPETIVVYAVFHAKRDPATLRHRLVD